MIAIVAEFCQYCGVNVLGSDSTQSVVFRLNELRSEIESARANIVKSEKTLSKLIVLNSSYETGCGARLLMLVAFFLPFIVGVPALLSGNTLPECPHTLDNCRAIGPSPA